jgi:hypothetical protein
MSEDLKPARIGPVSEGKKPPGPPKGLSAARAARWRHFVGAHEFSVAELHAWEMHLREGDEGDRLAAAGELKAAHDAWTRSFRWYRSLKFSPATGSTRIGRRPDAGWSAMRSGGAGHAV